MKKVRLEKMIDSENNIIYSMYDINDKNQVDLMSRYHFNNNDIEKLIQANNVIFGLVTGQRNQTAIFGYEFFDSETFEVDVDTIKK